MYCICIALCTYTLCESMETLHAHTCFMSYINVHISSRASQYNFLDQIQRNVYPSRSYFTVVLRLVYSELLWSSANQSNQLPKTDSKSSHSAWKIKLVNIKKGFKVFLLGFVIFNWRALIKIHWLAKSMNAVSEDLVQTICRFISRFSWIMKQHSSFNPASLHFISECALRHIHTP